MFTLHVFALDELVTSDIIWKFKASLDAAVASELSHLLSVEFVGEHDDLVAGFLESIDEATHGNEVAHFTDARGHNLKFLDLLHGHLERFVRQMRGFGLTNQRRFNVNILVELFKSGLFGIHFSYFSINLPKK